MSGAACARLDASARFTVRICRSVQDVCRRAGPSRPAVTGDLKIAPYEPLHGGSVPAAESGEPPECLHLFRAIDAGAVDRLAEDLDGAVVGDPVDRKRRTVL